MRFVISILDENFLYFIEFWNLYVPTMNIPDLYSKGIKGSRFPMDKENCFGNIVDFLHPMQQLALIGMGG